MTLFSFSIRASGALDSPVRRFLMMKLEQPVQ